VQVVFPAWPAAGNRDACGFKLGAPGSDSVLFCPGVPQPLQLMLKRSVALADRVNEQRCFILLLAELG